MALQQQIAPPRSDPVSDSGYATKVWLGRDRDAKIRQQLARWKAEERRISLG
jgi:hypothetical protein